MIRRFALASLLVLSVSAAHAQQRYSITVSDPELNLIGKALGKLPFEEVQALVSNITAQIGAQQKAAADAAAKSSQDAIDKAIAEKLKADADKKPAE